MSFTDYIVDIYKNWRLYRNLNHDSLDPNVSFQGCSFRELLRIENSIWIKIPKIYRQFLFCFGNTLANNIPLQQNPLEFIEMMNGVEEKGDLTSNFHFPEDMFIIWADSNNFFLDFVVRTKFGKDNPPVFFLDTEEPSHYTPELENLCRYGKDFSSITRMLFNQNWAIGLDDKKQYLQKDLLQNGENIHSIQLKFKDHPERAYIVLRQFFDYVIVDECFYSPPRLTFFYDEKNDPIQNHSVNYLHEFTPYYGNHEIIDYKNAQISPKNSDFIQKVKGKRIIEINFEIRQISLDLAQISEDIDPFNNLHQVRRMDLYNLDAFHGLKNIDQLRNLKWLIITNGKIKSLPNLIGSITNLEYLFLQNLSEMENIPETFSQLNNLKVLVISRCPNIRSLPDSFGKLERLEYLSLRSTSIERLPESFGLLKCLKSVDLADNRLKFLPENLSRLVSLTYFHAEMNNIKKIPVSISKCRSLRVLNLGVNKIASIPDSIAELSGLEVLNLYGNPLVEIPPAIDAMRDRGVNVKAVLEEGETWGDRGALIAQGTSKLTDPPVLITPFQTLAGELDALKSLGKSIRVSFTVLDEIPKTPPAVPSYTVHRDHITGLWLPGCQLTGVPPQIALLPALEVIGLASNHIVCLPEGLGMPQTLRSLDLSDNFLLGLPDVIGKLQRLETLDLSRNRLLLLPPALGRLPKLTTLDLSFNRLDRLPIELGSLQALVALNIGHNDLDALPGWVAALPLLQVLRASHNRLRGLPPEFTANRAIQVLDLAHNRLTEFPDAIRGMIGLESLNCAENWIPAAPAALHSHLPKLKDTNFLDNLF